MPEPVKIFLAFLIGFGLWETFDTWTDSDPLELGTLAVDVVAQAVIATVLVVAYERWKRRKASADA